MRRHRIHVCRENNSRRAYLRAYIEPVIDQTLLMNLITEILEIRLQKVCYLALIPGDGRKVD
jgi:hypothetical protein